MGIVLFTIFFLVFYAYLGYPLILFMIPWKRKHYIDESFRPTVTLLVAAYNEIDVIEKKIQNSFALEYPDSLIEYVFVSDGSDDGTTEVLKKYENERLRVLVVKPRGGKAGALRKGMKLAKGSIIVLSDANTMIDPNAIIKLVRHFVDREVGGVSGDVKIEQIDSGFGKSEGLYYKIERFIQKKESDIGTIIGVDGALYAVRKELLNLPDDYVILDDFIISMNITTSGYRVLYDSEVLAEENATPSINQEINRKSRIVAGGFQAIFKYNVFPKISRPWSFSSFISHKLLRWISPILIISAIGLNTIIVFISDAHYIYDILLASQVCFYLFGVIGWVHQNKLRNPIFAVPFYFTMVNCAVFLGVIKYAMGWQKVTWKKVDRISSV